VKKDERDGSQLRLEHRCKFSVYKVSFESPAATGIYEALELRDRGLDYLGKGVSKVTSLRCRSLIMILPVGTSSFKESMKMGVEVYHSLKPVIKKKYGQDATNVGDEGSFSPDI
ncbi:Enolase, partial [Cynara cardunculus var. scolymus]